MYITNLRAAAFVYCSISKCIYTLANDGVSCFIARYSSGVSAGSYRWRHLGTPSISYATMYRMDTSILLIDLHYLPCLEYFVRLLPYNTIRLEAQESYRKQSYRNRCYTLSTQSVVRMTVPVRRGSSKIRYRLTEIVNDQPWGELHWRTLRAGYGKAPYFQYLAEHFRDILLKRYDYLFDLNLALLRTCLRLLGIEKNIELSEHYAKTPSNLVIDARHSIHPSTRLVPSIYYRNVPYTQVFGQVFSSNLSIMDLLFCEGYEAGAVLRQMVRTQ